MSSLCVRCLACVLHIVADVLMKWFILCYLRTRVSIYSRYVHAVVETANSTVHDHVTAIIADIVSLVSIVLARPALFSFEPIVVVVKWYLQQVTAQSAGV